VIDEFNYSKYTKGWLGQNGTGECPMAGLIVWNAQQMLVSITLSRRPVLNKEFGSRPNLLKPLKD